LGLLLPEPLPPEADAEGEEGEAEAEALIGIDLKLAETSDASNIVFLIYVEKTA